VLQQISAIGKAMIKWTVKVVSIAGRNNSKQKGN